MTKIIMAFEIDDDKTFKDFKKFVLNLAGNKKLSFVDTEENLLKISGRKSHAN